MPNGLAKRSVLLDGRKTSVSVEEVFWISLKELAREREMTLSELVASIDEQRVASANLSSAIRVHVLERVRRQIRDLEARVPVPNVATAVVHAPRR